MIVVGGANVDFLVRSERLPAAGETLQGDTFLESPGGKGANQAVAAARLGARVAFVGRIGTDARGDALIATLERERVDVSRVRRDREAPTGVALIAVDRSGEKQILVAPGANGRLSPEDVERAGEAIASARVLLTQLEVPLPCVALALERAHAAGAATVLDPAPARPLEDALLRRVSVIRPNSGEAGVLTGMPVSDRAEASRAARALLGRGVGAAIVQAGEEGDLLVTGGEERLYPRLPVKSVDATGAGDAFAGALAAALAEGRPLPEAAARGNAAAALATTRFGAQAGLPSREELERLLESHAR